MTPILMHCGGGVSRDPKFVLHNIWTAPNTEKFAFFCQDFLRKHKNKSKIKGCLANLHKFFSFRHMTHSSVPLFEVGFVFPAYKNMIQFPVWWKASKRF